MTAHSAAGHRQTEQVYPTLFGKKVFMRVVLLLFGLLLASNIALAQSWLQFPQSVTLKEVSEGGKVLRTVYPAAWPLPGYPIDVLRAGIYRGSATLRLTVKEDCSITDIQVVRSTVPEFGESSKEAVSRWRFIRPPGSKAEKWAPAVIECRFDFLLDEK